MIGSFATSERAYIVQEAKEFQASLIGVLASIQDRAQQTVDALGQHAAAPRATQHLAQGVPGHPELFWSEQQGCFIQAFFPQKLPRLTFRPGYRVTFSVCFDLPDTGQCSDSRCTPLLNQRRKGLLQDGQIAKQSFRPVGEIAAQFLVDTTLPFLKLLPQSTQAHRRSPRVSQFTTFHIEHRKLSIHLLGNQEKGIVASDLFLRFGAQPLPSRQMLFQSLGRVGLVKLGRPVLNRLQSSVRLPFQASDLSPQRTQQVVPVQLMNLNLGRLGTSRQPGATIAGELGTIRSIQQHTAPRLPIGTFIFWKTKEELRHVRNIGNVELPGVPPGEFVHYVLDGQQRITSLYAVRKGIRLTKEGKEIDYRDISINLDLDPDDDERVVTIEPTDGAATISVHKLLSGSVIEFLDEYDRGQLEKIEAYQKRLKGYDFSTIVISEYPIDVACEVFTRINTGGTELTLFEIMVAKTYDQPSDFDLAREYDWLIENDGSEKDLEDAGFDTVPASTVLQCIAAHVSGHVRRRDILKLRKEPFIRAWPTVKDGIFSAVDYLRTHLRVPVSRLLPYNALLVPLTYFFIRRDGEMPTPVQNRFLVQYFWWASLTNRFSSGVEGKIAQDLERMDAILAGQSPSYRGEELDLTLDDLRWRWFSAGDAFCKAVICLYAHFIPRSFKTDGLVKLDNSWLKVANSKNYHHFFPKSYLRKQGFESWQANSVLNITIVDDYLNKRTIRARPPSEYMRAFQAGNPQLAETMQTHLIDDMDDYGIWQDDYLRFIERRGERVLAELQSRLGFGDGSEETWTPPPPIELPQPLPPVEPGVSVAAVRRMVTRRRIPDGQRALYTAFYAASDEGMTTSQLFESTGRTAQELAGVLGALGNRINRTEGLEDLGATTIVLDIRQAGSQWRYRMRPVLREALEAEGLV